MNQKRIVILLLFFVLLLHVPALSAQDEVGDILARINNLRASKGLAIYTMNSALSAAAQQQAQWIVDNGDVSHTHPDGSGPRSRAQAVGYPSTAVSENIYGGTMANVDYAWNFWINSPIHYEGMVNRAYSEIGIGVAHGAWGASYVTVFGNPAGYGFVAPASGGASSGGGSAPAGPPPPPSYIVGVDNNGNIMHEVQPGDTLGDIALIYGYTWDDLPYMMQINGMTDVRDLEEGSIFLVPPHAGTYTPTPGGELPTTTPTPDAALPQPSATPEPPTAVPTATLLHVATAVSAPDSILSESDGGDSNGAETTPNAVALPVVLERPTNTPDFNAPVTASTAPTIIRSGASPWLTVALVVQVGIVAAAGFEFFRRRRR